MHRNTSIVFNIIKYITIYFIFTVLVLINKIHGNLYNIIKLFPSFEILITFILFLWVDKNYKNLLISKNNLFFFGLIFDTFNFLPIGLTSISFLISYKICHSLKQIFINNNNISYFIRDLFIYISTFYIIQWFIFSVYNSNFYRIGNVTINIFRDFIYGVIIYIIYKKYINAENV